MLLIYLYWVIGGGNNFHLVFKKTLHWKVIKEKFKLGLHMFIPEKSKSLFKMCSLFLLLHSSIHLLKFFRLNLYKDRTFFLKSKCFVFVESIQRLGLALGELKVDKSKMVLNFQQQNIRPKPPSRHKQNPDTSHNV